MYLKKISFKAFKDYLKNPTDPFLEGNIYITDSVAKYFRFVRAPAAKGEHTVEILYGGTQHQCFCSHRRNRQRTLEGGHTA